MIFVIDDDPIFAECVAMAVRGKTRKKANDSGNEVLVFGDAINAMNKIAEGVLPELIFLDILLDGPDGFTFLNELISYEDSTEIPIVIMSSLDFTARDLADYNVVGVLDKETLRPEEIQKFVERYNA